MYNVSTDTLYWCMIIKGKACFWWPTQTVLTAAMAIYCHKVQEQYQVSLYMKNTLVSRMVEISDSIRCAISRVETLKSTNRKTTVFLLLLPNGMHSNFQVRKYFLRKVVVNCGTLLQLLQLQPIMAIWDLLMEKQMERELYLLLKIWLLTLQIGGTLPQGKETVGWLSSLLPVLQLHMFHCNWQHLITILAHLAIGM